MGILRQLFGPSKREIWTQLCEQTGAQLTDGGFFGRDKVQAGYGEWTFTLDTYTVSSGKHSHTYTRMRAPYVNPEGFRFTIYRSSIFSPIGKFFGLQDITIGEPKFDEEFIIRGTDEARVRALFARPAIRELISRQPRIHLAVKDDEGWFGPSFPEGVDELCFHVSGVMKDLDQLKGLFELFAEVLDQLCEMGAAYEGDPQIRI